MWKNTPEKVKNNKAIETRNVFDTQLMYQQLGYELTKKKLDKYVIT